MVSAKLEGLTIAVVPGTGRMGRALAEKLAAAGLPIIVGSRTAAKAEAVAAEISAKINKNVKGLPLAEAAAAGDVIIWAIKGDVTLTEREEVLKSLAKHLEGKVIIDVSNMLFEEKDWGQVATVLWSQKALGVPARWTTAWKATFYKIMENPPPVSHPSAVLVPGDDEGAVDITVALVDSIPGFKAIRAGPLKNAKITELFSSAWLLLLDQLNAGGNWRSSFSYFDYDALN